ncbi:MAG: hypothetical protein ACK6D7_17525 [Acidobacteriota bacterium]
MVDEGIFSYFRHSGSGYTLVLPDNPATHKDLPAVPVLYYDPDTSHGDEVRIVYSWEKQQTRRSGKRPSGITTNSPAKTSKPRISSPSPSRSGKPATPSLPPATTPGNATTTLAATPSASTASPPPAASSPANSTKHSTTATAPPTSAGSRQPPLHPRPHPLARRLRRRPFPTRPPR